MTVEEAVQAVAKMEWNHTTDVLSLDSDATHIPFPNELQRRLIQEAIVADVDGRDDIEPSVALADALESENWHIACSAIDVILSRTSG